MKTTIIRYALTLTFCTFALGGWGQEDTPFTGEDFQDFTFPTGINWMEGAITINEWTVYGCSKIQNPPSLNIEGYTVNNKYHIGYAITPKLNFTGDVYLTFIHTKRSKNDSNVKLNLSIEVSGLFADTYTDNKELPNTQHINDNNLKSETFCLLNVTNDTRIKFATIEKKAVVIDEVIVTKLPKIEIKESNDNTTTIRTNEKETVTVNTHRTLLGGIWNTLCMPFDVSMADLELALGENQDIQVRTFYSYDSETKVMTFVDPFESDPSLALPAGTPFLIKLNSDVENPTFHAVTISNTAAQSIGEEGPVHFVGTYSPVELATDGTNIFITKDNTLALPAAGKNTMNGLRAYIVVPKNFDSSSARLLMDDGETASVSDLAPSVETCFKATYSLNGQRVENVRRGLYVVNGKLTFVK